MQRLPSFITEYSFSCMCVGHSSLLFLFYCIYLFSCCKRTTGLLCRKTLQKFIKCTTLYIILMTSVLLNLFMVLDRKKMTDIYSLDFFTFGLEYMKKITVLILCKKIIKNEVMCD